MSRAALGHGGHYGRDRVCRRVGNDIPAYQVADLQSWYRGSLIWTSVSTGYSDCSTSQSGKAARVRTHLLSADRVFPP